MDVTIGSGNQARGLLKHLWANDDDLRRVGHGEATVWSIGGHIEGTEFESIIPSPSHHLGNSHGVSGLYIEAPYGLDP